ncbi:hypothetical protein [uncultured Cohaesibacter sp.]|nr:hypothetical protein [uncultured Cohaesibacter sp.]
MKKPPGNDKKQQGLFQSLDVAAIGASLDEYGKRMNSDTARPVKAD